MCIRDRFNTVSDKEIAIFGFAFKKDTNDTRESPSIYVCRDLLEERAKLTIYDPKVDLTKIKMELTYLMANPDGTLSDLNRDLINNNVRVADSCEKAADGAHAIAVLTEWDEFKTADFKNFGPIRESVPIALATSSTSAPVASHNALIALIDETR